jgi:putative DNA primase/helicase
MSGAAIVAKALGGRKVGSDWTARCPAHDDRSPSLSIRDGNDGKVLVRCHAGCTQPEVIAVLRSRGLWKQNDDRLVNRTARQVAANDRPDRNESKRTARALAIWQAAAPAKGTLVESYLLSRGLRIPPPPTLRFHPRLKHPSGTIWPAMVALVTRASDGAPIAIHRTFIAREGAGKAPVEPQKMMLGPCRGGGVLLGMPADMLMIGEGIETCLAAMQATGNPTLAALSTSGLRTLDLPADVRQIIALLDGDDASEAAFRVAAACWQREGRRVRFARPPRGFDFNDMLLGRTSSQAKDTP